MRKFAVLLAAASMAIAAPAMAAFEVKVGAPILGIPNNNNFQGLLFNSNLFVYTADGASINLSEDSKLTFEFIGSESGFSDGFKADGGAVSFSENTGAILGNTNPALPWTVLASATADYNAGAITDWFFNSVQGVPSAKIGDAAFGIFLPRGLSVGDIYKSDVLYLGFDDQPKNADDNHDDFIVRITAVGSGGPEGIPEPASWTMLITGFGLVGAASRRRNKALTVAA